MNPEKKVQYTAQSTYATLGDAGPETRNIWIAFHGMGYLSRYFLRYFDVLDSKENYVIAPQAPSKYYLDDNYKNVGANWLTRIDTRQETANVLRYVDAVWEAEKEHYQGSRLIVLGYSQGVSIATRWLASRKMVCDHLVLHSGGIPKELEAGDFDYLPGQTRVTYLYGDKDQYIDEARLTGESLKANKLFGDRLDILVFDGKHEVNRDFIRKTAAWDRT